MGDEATTAAELEAWVRAELALPEEATVGITEKPGSDPRCSEMVTEVAVVAPGDEPWSFHIEAALADMVPMDLVAALAFGGGH
ncbi:MAG: hypothetical protein M3011_05445 [Actinomycetota bacterium]|nr:hypothetical protein [Actinomycetota bacterium]